MPTRVHIDISVFTEDEAVGNISGQIGVPILPQIGDALTFDLQGADLVLHKAAFAISPITVTHRLIPVGGDGIPLIMLDEITAKAKDEALQIMAFFEDCHGLLADRWDEEDLKVEQWLDPGPSPG